MQYLRLLLLWALVLPGLCGCGSFPPRRINTAIIPPRVTVFADRPATTKESSFHLHSTYNRTSGWIDNGESREGNSFVFHGEYQPHARLGLGIGPWVADAMAMDSGSEIGGEAFLRWRMYEHPRWALSLYTSLRFVEHESSEEFCSDPSGFFQVCNNPDVVAKASIHLLEPGLALLVEHLWSDGEHGVALVPTVYYTDYHSENFLSSAAPAAIVKDEIAWNYSLMLYYLWRSAESSRGILTLGLGVLSQKSFATGASKRTEQLNGQLSWRYSF